MGPVLFAIRLCWAEFKSATGPLILVTLVPPTALQICLKIIKLCIF